eukprot:CAMPEP_0203694936 /NCGR_PEP_ID=MMETSP0091-20130426/6534_1 /ASSEMBLY_ACC=CAM_ASM_001089 /TAXON_ID=426623 /ORGANISM="Chaetoceros affinis, Strain CCMP159" /LENGTH=637 /DNA_ID=CAMNT_0050566387 /DNA_START=49 /DNA_END=1962 /DNA_ORIENTATION=+
MGCQQSKAVNHSAAGIKTQPTSPMSSSSWGNASIPRDIQKISDPGERLFRLLTDSREDDLIWARVVKLCEQAPASVCYKDPESLDTPLHLACRLIATVPASADNLDASPLDAIRVMIRCSADPSSQNREGNIPLHDAIRPIVDQSGTMASIRNQVEVVNFLIAADYEVSMEYLSRDDVVFSANDDECTPLYHVVANLPDDFTKAPGPTVHLVSTVHFPKPSMVAVKNLSNYDKPLALLYRRFSRQFDLSEKFFPGDNSRDEVVAHRQKYKVAAMNTWKVILALLDPIADKRKSVSDFFMVHAAVRIETPPDLLRYIIETRPEEVRQPNDEGRLPLHVAANASTHAAESSYHYKFVIDELLYSYPDGAASTDSEGKLPLELAIESEKKWIGGGIKSLHDVYPDAMSRVKMEEYPSIQRALSFSTNFAEERDSCDESVINENGIVKEEHYDAIMLVQKSDADLGDIVSAMWANEEDGGVQMLGCVAITSLAKKYQSDQQMLRTIAMSAVNTIVNAMKNHPNEPAVQEKGCAALNLLAPADNYREVSFAASGAVASIVAAMQAHVSDAIVQQEACSALRNILKYGGSDRATVIASVSGFTAIQNALFSHPGVQRVQEEGSCLNEALKAFPDAYLPEQMKR